MHGDEEPLHIPITDVFDLHTVEPREVAAVVEAYLDEAARLGFDNVRIIHGRGTGVQQRIVRAALARTPFVSSYRVAPPEGSYRRKLAPILARARRQLGLDQPALPAAAWITPSRMVSTRLEPGRD